MRTIGRLILVPAEIMLPGLIDYYKHRSDFLVIGYNKDNFSPSRSYPVPLIPYRGVGREIAVKYGFGEGAAGHPLGTVWRRASTLDQTFPEIQFWIIHDYDVVCKPHDREIADVVPENCYGMIGLPIPRYKPAIDETAFESSTFPFTHQTYRTLWHAADEMTARNDHNFLDVLENEFPFIQNGITTVLCGYGDIIAAPVNLLRCLRDKRLDPIEIGGIEQVIHNIAFHNHFKPFDLSKAFRTRVHFSALSWFADSDQIIHPLKELRLVQSKKAKYLWAYRTILNRILNLFSRSA